MSQHQLDYWVFTSGEDGEHGLDWGVKFASSSLQDRRSLDVRYRALLKDFVLPPSLVRPEHGVGLCLLPWEDGAILSFIFPGTDHGGRPNTSTVVCVLPLDSIGTMSVNQAAQRIWEKNDLAGIAARNSEKRPDALLMDGANVVSSSSPVFISAVKWPGRCVGYLQIDGTVKTLVRKEEVIAEKDKGGKKFQMSMLLLAAAIVAGVAWNWLNEPKPIGNLPHEDKLSPAPNIVVRETPAMPEGKTGKNEARDSAPSSSKTGVPNVPVVVKEDRANKDATDKEKFKADLISLVDSYKLGQGNRQVRLNLKRDIDPKREQALLDIILKLAEKGALKYDDNEGEIVLYLSKPIRESLSLEELEECLDIFLKQFQ